ncbi:MAG: hypothetical protein ACPGOV_12100 [Magnetovibrionaceae bacterium]
MKNSRTASNSPTMARRFLLSGLGLALLTGCGALSPFKFIPLPFPDLSITRTRVLNMEVAARANENSPIAVDVIITYDEDMYKALLELSARDWFTQKDQFRLDFPTGYDLWSWEVVPGQLVEPVPLSDDVSRAVGSVVYADYGTEGAHRARIDQLTNVLISLGEQGFTVDSFLPASVTQ